MVFFITVLRALAAVLITNSHYTGIYPTDIIANGGLLGDIVFFAVSGYCLFNIKLPFHKWYLKRITRIYIPVWVITIVFVLMKISQYQLYGRNIIDIFVYPTNFHFIASIVFLYIPFYIISKIQVLRKNIPWVILFVAVVAFVVFIFAIDKTKYTVDEVNLPFIRFLFMESMLLGAFFKHNEKQFKNVFKIRYLIMFLVLFVTYFSSKIVFSQYGAKYAFLNQIQILNQVVILGLLYFLFRIFMGIDEKLDKLPKIIKKIITFIADRTLEIYLVQIVIIKLLAPKFSFPVNWIVITSAIILSASILHMVCGWIYKLIDFIENLFKKEKITQNQSN